jgi:stearoyl-CoA desaturase (delta-9 desaturase)
MIFIVAVHILSLVGVILYPLPGWKVVLGALLMACAGGLGTTVGYHRALSHRAVKLNPVVEQILIFFACFNASGSPSTWIANHRNHHANSDTVDDVSSPRHGGFWWAHLRWLYQTVPADVKRWAPDLNKPEYNFWDRAEPLIVLISIFCGLLFGWKAFFWVGAIRLVYSLHLQCFVNSITHMGESDESGKTAKNLWWLGPLQLTAWGENWHGNHHRFANSARLGLKWWEVDLGWYFIWTLEKVGLASGVKCPKTS